MSFVSLRIIVVISCAVPYCLIVLFVRMSGEAFSSLPFTLSLSHKCNLVKTGLRLALNWSETHGFLP